MIIGGRDTIKKGTNTLTRSLGDLICTLGNGSSSQERYQGKEKKKKKGAM